MHRVLLSIILVLYFTTGNSQTVRLTPGSIGYRLTKATEQARLKNYDKAILIVDSAMSIDSSNQHVIALKSELLWLKKEYHAAALCYRKAMSLDKDSSYLKGADLFLGVLFEKAGFRDEAQKHYLKAVDLFENHKRKDDRFFENSNGIDYAVALILSGTHSAWRGIMSSPKFERYKELYKGKTREQVLQAYWSQYDGG